MLNKIQSLNALRTFEVCTRLGSVQDAAAQLHVTPSAVSHQIRKLEDELELALFIRSHRKITPTAQGKILYDAVQKSFSELSETLQKLRAEHVAELSINVLPVFSIRWLNPRLLTFFEAHPNIDLTIKNSYRVEDLAQQSCDLAIRWGNGDWDDVYSEKLYEEYALPVAHPRVLENAKVKNQEDLLKIPLIQSFEGAKHWENWIQLNQLEQVDKLKFIKFNDPAGALQAAIDGLGLILAPISLIQTELKNGVLVSPFGPPLPTGNAYYLVWPKNKQHGLSQYAKDFKAWIQEEVKKQSYFNRYISDSNKA